MDVPILSIRDLRIDLGGVRVVDDVTLDVGPGETVGLVGESGCGKSVTALSIARLLPPPPRGQVHGGIRLAGTDVAQASPAELRALRGGVVSYVFQEPSASLHPTQRVGNQILEALRLHRPDRAQVGEVVRLLERVGIAAPDLRARDYPHQLSGGMQQRVMMAMAIASEPRLLVADEPTTALDVTIQAQILERLRDLQRHSGTAILLISHNLGIVADIANRVAVMYAGEIVESGPTTEVLRQPHHPYTRALVASVPEPGRLVPRLATIEGTVPAPGNWPAGCRFAPRCPHAIAPCHTRHPNLLPLTDSRASRCPVVSIATGAPRPSP